MAKISQLEASTYDYFKLKGDKVNDLYTETSFFLDYFLKMKEGLWDNHQGGKRIGIPLRFDDNSGGFFVRGDALNSTKTNTLTEVTLDWKYASGNATVYQIDSWENKGIEQKINLLTHELEGAQITLNKILANSVWEGLEADPYNLTGFNAITDTTATQNYAGYSSNDIESRDGTKVWTGLGSSDTTQLALSAIRTIRTAAAFGDGKMQEPDLIGTTETNYNTIKTILDASQILKEGVKTARIGFSGVHFEGCDIYPDRFCPASNLYAFNSKHVGFTVNVLWKRSKWQIIANSPDDKTMKIMFGGNLTCDNRRANFRQQNIS